MYESLCRKLDILHQKGYRIALLAVHDDGGVSGDCISMYRNVALDTQLQLEVIFRKAPEGRV